MAAWIPIAAAAISAAAQNWNVNRSVKAQQMENAKMRAYNLGLAEKQNQWSLAQWNRENEYNSPSAQMVRLKHAGINADMMYGGGLSGNISAQSPSLTSGASANPMDWSSLANMRNPMDTLLDQQLKQAQIDNINADTTKKGHEASILASDAAFRDAINQGQLDGLYSTIHLQGVQADSTAKLSEQDIKESQHRIMQIDSNVSQINAEIQRIYNSIKNDNERLNLDKALSKSNIEHLAADCHLKYEQANNIASQLEKILRDWDDKHDLNQQQFIYIQNQDIKQYHETEKIKAETSGIKIANGRAEFEAYLNGPNLFDASQYGFWNSSMQFTYRLMKSILAK